MTQGEWFTNHWRHHGTVHGDENTIPQWMGDNGTLSKRCGTARLGSPDLWAMAQTPRMSVIRMRGLDLIRPGMHLDDLQHQPMTLWLGARFLLIVEGPETFGCNLDVPPQDHPGMPSEMKVKEPQPWSHPLQHKRAAGCQKHFWSCWKILKDTNFWKSGEWLPTVTIYI